MRLLLIRHAQSTSNQTGRMAGQGECDLSSQGRQQAVQLGAWLWRLLAAPSHLYSSPARRARQTAAILLSQGLPPENLTATLAWLNAASPNPAADVQSRSQSELSSIPLTLRITPAIHELHNGIFQGLTWAEAQQHHPDLCAALEASPDWLPIPGAETLEQGRDRARQFIQRLLQDHQQSDCLWVVTHGGILQQLVAALLGCDRAWGFPVANTALFEFEIDRDRWHRENCDRWNTSLWQIHRFNDTQHLQG